MFVFQNEFNVSISFGKKSLSRDISKQWNIVVPMLHEAYSKGKQNGYGQIDISKDDNSQKRKPFSNSQVKTLCNIKKSLQNFMKIYKPFF